MTVKELLLNLVQIGLTVSAVALALFVLRKVLKKRYPARAICFVWAILAIRLLIPVQLTLPDPPVQITPPARTLYVTYNWDTEPADDPVGTVQAQQTQHELPRSAWMTESEFETLQADGTWKNAIHVDSVLAVIWVIGMLYQAFWQARDYRRYLRKLNQKAADVHSETLRAVLGEQKQLLGITREILLRVSGAADCPMLAGFVKPVLWLPDENLTAQEAMFIFRHELTHYKRGDLWLKLLLAAAKAVHWFNPLVYLMARFAQEDIELACDDAVVRGMDSAERRAYGETILRSAAAQVRRRALVSCFTGDKKTLMRRFEGLFDKRAKKRGVALVVAVAVLVGTLGCTFSVGESGGSLTDEQIVQLGEQWMSGNYRDAAPWYQMLRDDLAQELYDQLAGETGEPVWEVGTSSPAVSRYTVIPDADNAQAVIVTEWTASGSVPTRQAERIHFTQVGEEWKVDRVEGNPYINDTPFVDTADSLEHFRLMYENDLGLPDYTESVATDAAERSREILRLFGGSAEVVRSWDVTYDGENDLTEVQYTFDNGEQLEIIMAAGRPQDYTYGDGGNNRTAADLAQQYARAVYYKSVWPLYPVLSGEEQQALVRQQQHLAASATPDMGEIWYSKYGGSSPSFRNYVIVPGKDENTCVAVFQMYGGGTTDYRSAIAITAGEENGRMVISEMERCDDHLSFIQDQLAGQDAGYTMREIFGLYYDSGLPWPDLQYGNTGETVASFYNGGPLTDLEQPLTAVENIFGYVSETYEEVEGNTTNIRRRTWFTAELISQTDTEAVVRLNFIDNSPSVDVRLEKTGDYWLPVGLAAQFDEGFQASANGEALPVGATVQEAMQNAAGNIPLLEEGDEIALLFDPAPQGEVTIADRVIREDGTLQYSERETETGTFSYTGGAASMSYRYPVEHLAAELLASTLTPYIYRGVTVSYTSADGTAHTDAFVFRLAGADIQTDYTITSTTYHNDTYGYTLTLPDCFTSQGYLMETADEVRFGLKNAWPGEFSSPYEGGAVMSVMAMSAAEMHDIWGENWTEQFPSPAVELAEHGGLVYYLAFASDVQYDPQDEAISAAYAEMRQAAEAMDSSSISFDGQTDDQRGREYERALYLLGRYYGARVSVANQYMGGVSTQPNPADGSCTIVWEIWTDMRPSHRAEQAWFPDMDEIAPVRTEALGNSADGITSLEQFRLFYDNEVGLPTFYEEYVRSLLEDTSIAALRDPVQAAEWTLGLSGGTASDQRIHPIWAGTSFLYQWPNGDAVRIAMTAVQLGDAAQPIYLPTGWSLDSTDEAWSLNPYRYMALKETNDFSNCSAEELAYYLTLSDGAYTENILHELDLRWQDDPAGTEAAVAAYADAANGVSSLQTIWESHKAANPDIFS